MSNVSAGRIATSVAVQTNEATSKLTLAEDAGGVPDEVEAGRGRMSLLAHALDQPNPEPLLELADLAGLLRAA